MGILMLILAITFIRCNKNSNAYGSGNTTSPNSYHVQLGISASLGNYLTNGNGQTLYFFSNDVNGKSMCSGSCEMLFPPVFDSSLTAAEVGTGLNLSDFSSVTGADGKQVLAYKGWPLYTYSPGGTAEATGAITGDGVAGIWFVAKPDYAIMLGNEQLVGGNDSNYTSTYSVGTGTTTFFTDARGLTLYTFAKDSADENKFTKTGFTNNASFPIYDTTSVIVPSVLKYSLFTVTNVFGMNQLSYNGWPLYYYGADSSVRGSTKGVSVGAPKVIWPVGVQSMKPAP